MGKAKKLSVGVAWRGILFIPILMSVFLLVVKHRIEDEDVRMIALIIAIVLVVNVAIYSAGWAGELPRKLQSKTAYLASLLTSALIGVLSAIAFFVTLAVGVDSLASLPNLINELVEAPGFVITVLTIAIAFSWFITIATWFEKDSA